MANRALFLTNDSIDCKPNFILYTKQAVIKGQL
jgi:hypothetical protein